MAEERLQKVLAGAGIASRRASEELILAGRVTVNGHTITELGTKVDPNLVQIAVDGKPIKVQKRHVYLKLNKPRGVISDVGGDMRGRQSVADLMPAEMRRLFPVGRLDLNSEGLVLMTDDGELANKLTHPRYEHPKTYYVLVSDRPPVAALDQLRQGVELSEGVTAPAEVRVVAGLPAGIRLASGPTNGVWLEIVLREGKKRQIRHMTAAVGYPTLRLIRWAIGPLTLDDLKAGESVPLTRKEVADLGNALRDGPRRAPIQNEPSKRFSQSSEAKRRPAQPSTQSSLQPKAKATVKSTNRRPANANQTKKAKPNGRSNLTPGNRTAGHRTVNP